MCYTTFNIAVDTFKYFIFKTTILCERYHLIYHLIFTKKNKEKKLRAFYLSGKI